MYAIEVRSHQGRVWLGVIRTFVSVQLFLQVWSVPLGAIIESPRSERASEEEAVNAMKWKQLKEGEREGPRQARCMSVCHCHCWPAPQLLISPKHNNTIGQ